MRLGRLVCAAALAGCGERALVVVNDAGVIAPPADATAVETPPPGTIDSVLPAGIADPTGGSTDVATLVALGDGGVVVAGSFSGMVAFAPDKVLAASGSRDAFLARYRRDQRLVWVRSLSAGTGEVVVTGTARLDGDEIAVAGWFSGTLILSAAAGGSPARSLTSAGGLDGFAARLASDGSVRWAVRAGGAGDDIVRGAAAFPVVVSPNGASTPGAVLLAGVVGSGAVFGPGEKGETAAPAGEGPIAVASLAAEDGTLNWVRFAGGGVPAQAYGIAADPVHRAVYLTGYVNGPVTFKGPNASYTVDPATGHAYVAQWDGSGALSWARGLAGRAGEGDSVTVTPQGDAVVAGTFEGDVTIPNVGVLHADRPGQPGSFLARLARSDGTVLWASRMAGIGLRPWRVRAMSGGDLLVAASFGGTVIVDPDEMLPTRIASAGDDDPVFMRFAGSGPLIMWATTGGGPGGDEGSDIVEGSDGFVWAAGRYIGPATFASSAGAVTLGSGTDGAGFILRLWP